MMKTNSACSIHDDDKEGREQFPPPSGSVSQPLYVPIWEKYTLSIEEAAIYFRIGENKLRVIVNEHRDADFVLCNGSRLQIKRRLFEKYIDSCSVI